MEIPMIAALILSPVNLIDKQPYHCIRCGRYQFSINRELLTVSLGTQYPANEIPRGMGWLNIKCHACKAEYNLYFQ